MRAFAERSLARRARLTAGHRTAPIAIATSGRTAALAVVAFALLATGGGAWLGAAAFTVALAVETLVVISASTPGLELEGSDSGTGDDEVARGAAEDRKGAREVDERPGPTGYRAVGRRALPTQGQGSAVTDRLLPVASQLQLRAGPLRSRAIPKRHNRNPVTTRSVACPIRSV